MSGGRCGRDMAVSSFVGRGVGNNTVSDGKGETLRGVHARRDVGDSGAATATDNPVQRGFAAINDPSVLSSSAGQRPAGEGFRTERDAAAAAAEKEEEADRAVAEADGPPIPKPVVKELTRRSVERALGFKEKDDRYRKICVSGRAVFLVPQFFALVKECHFPRMLWGGSGKNSPFFFKSLTRILLLEMLSQRALPCDRPFTPIP